jgi:hypothetical protein
MMQKKLGGEDFAAVGLAQRVDWQTGAVGEAMAGVAGDAEFVGVLPCTICRGF